jgi:hypothetical protein
MPVFIPTMFSTYKPQFKELNAVQDEDEQQGLINWFNNIIPFILHRLTREKKILTRLLRLYEARLSGVILKKILFKG